MSISYVPVGALVRGPFQVTLAGVNELYVQGRSVGKASGTCVKVCHLFPRISCREQGYWWCVRWVLCFPGTRHTNL